jgi:hypothetical protein
MSDASKLQRDIETWAIDRLATWFHDVAYRLEVIGKGRNEAEVAVAVLMLSVVAGDIATKTTADSKVVGDSIAGLIDHIRKREAQRATRKAGPAAESGKRKSN